MKKRNIIIYAIVTALILSIPLIAMQFTDEVKWTAFDFVFATVALMGSALIFEFVSSRGGTFAYRAATGLAVFTGLLLVWINGAAGIIGDEGSAANAMYFGVLLVGLIGAIIARLSPIGMSRTLFAMAVAHALVPVIAFFVWRAEFSLPPGTVKVFILNGFFVAMWLASGLLFKPGNPASRSAILKS
jgi:hypothetical protein